MVISVLLLRPIIYGLTTKKTTYSSSSYFIFFICFLFPFCRSRFVAFCSYFVSFFCVFFDFSENKNFIYFSPFCFESFFLLRCDFLFDSVALPLLTELMQMYVNSFLYQKQLSRNRPNQNKEMKKKSSKTSKRIAFTCYDRSMNSALQVKRLKPLAHLLIDQFILCRCQSKENKQRKKL